MVRSTSVVATVPSGAQSVSDIPEMPSQSLSVDAQHCSSAPGKIEDAVSSQSVDRVDAPEGRSQARTVVLASPKPSPSASV